MDVTATADPLVAMLSMQQAALQQQVGLAALKMQRDAEQGLVAMLDKAASTSANLAPGVGLQVDVIA